ncbi:MAG: hypothetical protein RLY20_1024, partial [Verrucomicrobiota bacterium]
MAVTVDRDSPSGGKLFVDGQVIYNFDPTGVSGNLVNNDVLRIGQHAAPGDPSYFPGVIDDVAIYKRALSTAEIQSIYNAGSAGKCTTPATEVCTPAPAGIVGWWPAETNATDAVSGANATLQGNVAYATGEVGQAFSLNSSDAAVVIPASAQLDVGNAEGLTVEAWINPTDVSDAHPLFEWNDGNYWGVHFHIAPGQPTAGSPGPGGPGQLYANVVDINGGWHQLGSSAGAVATGS